MSEVSDVSIAEPQTVVIHLIVMSLEGVASAAPLTSDLSASYASNGLIVVTLALALAVWSFRHALGGRKVLQGDFLEH